jgi:hypothetical protein
LQRRISRQRAPGGEARVAAVLVVSEPAEVERETGIAGQGFGARRIGSGKICLLMQLRIWI